MKIKNFLFITLTLCINTIISSCNNSQTSNKERPITLLKQADFEKIHFKYPADWTFSKQEFQNQMFLTSTPDSLKSMKTLNAFEIIQISPQGHSFSDFKYAFIESMNTRTQNEFDILNRKDTIFKGFEAVNLQARLFDRKDPTPAEIYAINGIDKYYVVTLMDLHRHYEVASKIKQITKEILNSLTIDK